MIGIDTLVMSTLSNWFH